MLFSLFSVIMMSSYVYFTNSFPNILSSEDEEALLKEYSLGELSAKNKLIEHNLRLVAHISKKYNLNNTDDSSDLISIGTIGLIKGVSTYKPDKKTKLATYVAKCIENEILMHIRTTKKYTNDLSLQDSIGVDAEGNEIKIEDKIANENYCIEDEVELRMDIRELEKTIKVALKGRERKVIELRYGLLNQDEMTQREIADMLNISRSYVSRIEKKALKKLADELLKFN